MASVTVRKIPDETKAKLAARARRHNRSLEAELRQILQEAAAAEAEPKAEFKSIIGFMPGALPADDLSWLEDLDQPALPDSEWEALRDEE